MPVAGTVEVALPLPAAGTAAACHRLLLIRLLCHRLLLIRRLLLGRLRNRLAGRSLRVAMGLPCAVSVSDAHRVHNVLLLGLAKLIIAFRNGLAVMLLLQRVLSFVLLLDLRLSLLHRLSGLLQFLKGGLVFGCQFQGLLSVQSSFVGFLSCRPLTDWPPLKGAGWSG